MATEQEILFDEPVTVKREVKDYAYLTGVEKSAILLLSVKQNISSKIISMLEEDEIKELSKVMATLGIIKSNTLEDIYKDFAKQISSAGGLIGTFESTERLLLSCLSRDQVDIIMSDIRGPSGRTMWEKLANVSEEFLANYLKNEYPQTVAVVLSKIKPEQAARVIPILPEGFALDVIMRMLRMEAIQRDVLEEIEKTLKIEFMNDFAKIQKRDSHELMAEIFNFFNRSNEAKFLEALNRRDPDSAEKVKALMFVFEDMIKINGEGIQLILRSIDRAKLGVALKGASENIRELFLKNMSERSAKLIQDEIQAMGPVRIKEVDNAQSQIIAITKEFIQRGYINIEEYDEEEEYL